jgi:hypothetical protein
MAHILKLRLLKNQILCPIPHAYVRELGLLKSQYVVVGKNDAGELTVRVLDDYLRVRGRLSGDPAHSDP